MLPIFIKVNNIQYPVGQGGLHLGEVFVNGQKLYAYIYDCGAVKDKTILYKQIDNLVDELKYKKNNITVYDSKLCELHIFLSHLHQDHVNGLMHLKEKLIEKDINPLNGKIKLYIPLTQDNEKVITICSYYDYDIISFDDYKNFIIDPYTFFNNFFKIIYVYNGMSNNEINIPNNCLFWVLKMYCKESEYDNLASLQDELQKLDIHNITHKDIADICKKLKKFYKDRDINTTSLCLYSGPILDDSKYTYFHTGDIDLTDKTVQDGIIEHYKKISDKVKIVQIPHHGSKNNSNLDILKKLFPNSEQFFVTKQENPNGRQQPKLSTEYENLDGLNQVTEKKSSKYATPEQHDMGLITCHDNHCWYYYK